MEKKSKNIIKWIIRIDLVVIAVIALMIAFSPYGSQEGFPYKLVKCTVEINAPVDSVFKFLGNSKNASRWSVYVDHITPLNADSFPDGSVGCRRRCFCNKDETGTQWDELTTERVPDKKRQLTIYNMKDFSMTAENLATEQHYEKTANNKCSLTFTVFFKGEEPGLWDSFKTYIAAYKINSIFEKNMANIKRIVETGK
jgi:uncharacterized protein YndB with AHSA1/START domain